MTLKRREFLLGSVGLTGALLSEIASAQSKPCPPPVMGVAGGQTMASSCTQPAPTALSGEIAALRAQSGPGWLLNPGDGTVKDIGTALNASANMGDGYSVLQVASTVLGSPYDPNDDWCNHYNYDPVAKQIIGYSGGVSSATAVERSFRIRYDEQENTWTRLRDPFSGTPTGHGLYGNAIDVAGRRAWRMNNATSSTFTTNGTRQIDLDTLAVTASIPRLGSSSGPGIAYLPSKNWLISSENQTIKKWDLTAGGPWIAISSILSDIQDNGCVFLLHPVTGRVLVGGGVDASQSTFGSAVYEIDTDGTTIRRTAFPAGVRLSMGGNYQALCCPDPGSTNWVVFNYDHSIWNLSSGASAEFSPTGRTVPTSGNFAAPNDPNAMNNRNVVALTNCGAIMLLVNRYFHLPVGEVSIGLYRHT